MTKVKFTVAGQRLRRITFPYLVRDSKNHIQLDFEFMTKDWKECEKKAIFDGKHEVDLVNDSVIVPVTQSIAPEFTVSVYGVSGETLITTNELTIQLNESGYVEGAVEPPEIQVEELKKELAELQASIKPEQEKTVDIAENGTTEITPDENKTLSKVIVNVDVPASGDTAELENLIDESGVLDSTDGTATDKVERLIEKVDRYNWLKTNSTGAMFSGNKTITTVNLDCSNMNTLQSAFSSCQKLNSVYLSNTQNIANWQGAFYASHALYTIETLDFSSAKSVPANTWNNWLVNLKVVPKTINCNFIIGMNTLSDESIQSIIDGLVIDAGYTLTVGSEVYGRLTDEQWAYIFGIGWDVT